MVPSTAWQVCLPPTAHGCRLRVCPSLLPRPLTPKAGSKCPSQAGSPLGAGFLLLPWSPDRPRRPKPSPEPQAEQELTVVLTRSLRALTEGDGNWTPRMSSSFGSSHHNNFPNVESCFRLSW